MKYIKYTISQIVESCATRFLRKIPRNIFQTASRYNGAFVVKVRVRV